MNINGFANAAAPGVYNCRSNGQEVDSNLLLPFVQQFFSSVQPQRQAVMANELTARINNTIFRFDSREAIASKIATAMHQIYARFGAG